MRVKTRLAYDVVRLRAVIDDARVGAQPIVERLEFLVGFVPAVDLKR